MGVNVVGHLTASSGLGNTARLFIRTLLQRGIQVAGLDVEAGDISDDLRIPSVQYVNTASELPYATNLIIISIQILPSLWLRRMPALTDGRFVNVGLVFWELQVVPQAWLPSLRMFDAIVVCSQFVRSAIELCLPTMPMVYAEHPLDPEVSRHVDLRQQQDVRKELGFRPTDVVFATSFDLRSDFARKNPLAVLRCFQLAFKDQPRARLLLKSSHGKTEMAGRAARLISEVLGDERVIYIDRTMPYLDVMRMYSACDVFVSLHRSEGLGLGPMEAMMLEKPVVATGYSGNLNFMNEQNSVLIQYSMVTPVGAAWQFSPEFSGKAAYWAEPDVDAAARAMRSLFHDAVARQTLGHAARRDVLQRQKSAWAAEFWTKIEALQLRPKSHAESTRLKRRIAFNEFLNPVLRRKNLEAICMAARQRVGLQVKG